MKIVSRLGNAASYLKGYALRKLGGVSRGEYDAQVAEKSRLAGRVSELAGQLGEKDGAYIDLTERCVATERELTFLRREYGDLAGAITSARNLSLYALKVAKEARTNDDVMHARAKDNAGSVLALVEWQRTYAGPLEAKLNVAQAEAATLKSMAFGSAFGEAVGKVLEKDSSAMQIPVAYYGFVNGKFYYTPAALEFLGEKGSEEGSENLTIGQLMSYIRKEDRQGIFKSLRSGKGLKHHEVSTTSGRQLKLTTKPFVYDGKAIGAAIFLNDPKFSFKTMADSRMYRRLGRLFKKISTQLEETLERARQGKLEPAL